MILRFLSARTLLVVTTIASLFALVAICLFVQMSMTAVSDKANALEAARSVESMKGAIAAAVKSITGVTLDNSEWDEAYKQAYSDKLDQDWIYSTWGAVSATGDNYDAVFLVDEHLRTVVGYVAGQRVGDPAATAPALPSDWAATQFGTVTATGPVSGVVTLASRPAVASLNLIKPVSGAVTRADGHKRYLVLVRYLTPHILAQYTDLFSLRQVHLGAPQQGQSFLPLTTLTGQAIGKISWITRKPGIEAVRAVQPLVTDGLVLIGFVVIAMLIIVITMTLKLMSGQARMRTLALVDALSGLPNRTAFMHGLAQDLSPDRPSASRTAVILIDLDGFKDVNDTYGHHVGDQLIVAVSALFRSLCPANGRLARLGGDEFALAVPCNAGTDGLDTFVRNVLLALEAPIRLDARVVQIGASFGISHVSDYATPATELVRQADVAMYAAKHAGKGRMVRYSAALDSERQDVARLSAEMRQGLANDEFDVVYQGIYDSKTGAYGGVEALLRWPRRPDGPIGPAVFIPVAEQSGLIHDLGLFVLERACRDWRDHPGLYVSVNVSPSQFRDPAFESRVAQILTDAAFPPPRLELELTEGYLIDRPERAKQAIETFKALGVHIVLDDFGTGYTSIAYLQSYGFDKIKLDKSLIDHLATDPKAAVIVQGVMFLATGLSMEITAEGVETEVQARLLEIAGCHLLQGYHYSRPVTAGELIAEMTPVARLATA